MIVKLKATRLFQKIEDAFTMRGRFIVLQGGARSSKTYTIAQYLILKCVKDWAGKNKVITIARKTFPALRASVMRDFFEILETLKLYHPENHNKTTNEYKLNGNLIEFVAVDQPQKVRGRKRDICWLNEANEFEYEDYFQFRIRTNEKIFFDYNPSDEYHWIYEKVLPKKSCYFIKSTYKDNPFLNEELKKEIESLKDEDENLWKIYGLGEIGKAQDLVYTKWDTVEKFPPVCEYYRYGLDFGYTQPTALVLVGFRGDDVYTQELLYQTKLTNQDFIDKMIELDIAKNIEIKADGAEPARIAEIASAGFKISAAKKDKASNKDAIDNIRRRRLHIHKDSINLIKEIKNYRYKRDKKTNELEEDPIKFKDHLMDALKYACGDFITDKRYYQKGFDTETRYLPRRVISNVYF